MRLGYNTNGFAFHHWKDALDIIAELGYESVAITIDHNFLNPYSENFRKRLKKIKKRLDRLQLKSVIETGARFLLDPHNKHEPTLLCSKSKLRDQRIDFLEISLEIAQFLESDAVSFWSGISKEGLPREKAFRNLTRGCKEVLAAAEVYDVPIAFEPEPGMLIESMADFKELDDELSHELFGLTIDIGHLQCVEDAPIPEILNHWKDRIFNIHIEDMKRGVHDHLMFGEGEIDFPPVLETLRKNGYTGGLHVELSRHSHDAVNVARDSYEFLSTQ